MAQCYYQLANYTNAITILERIIVLNPNDSAAQK